MSPKKFLIYLPLFCCFIYISPKNSVSNAESPDSYTTHPSQSVYDAESSILSPHKNLI